MLLIKSQFWVKLYLDHAIWHFLQFEFGTGKKTNGGFVFQIRPKFEALTQILTVLFAQIYPKMKGN